MAVIIPTAPPAFVSLIIHPTTTSIYSSDLKIMKNVQATHDVPPENDAQARSKKARASVERSRTNAMLRRTTGMLFRKEQGVWLNQSEGESRRIQTSTAQ